MPPTPRPPKPLESFGPEVMQALIEGSKREVRLSLPYHKAAHFRQRANSLRAEMRRQNHALYHAVSAATLRIEWPESTEVRTSVTNVRTPKNRTTPVTLVISPADKEFGEALRKAGIEVKPLSLDTPSPANTETPVIPVDDALSRYLEEPSDATNK